MGLTHPQQPHQFVLRVGQVCLLVAVVMGRPAVGDQEVEDGRVVGHLRTGPADHQGAAVHMLHLHVDGSAAAHCEEAGDQRRQGIKRWSRKEELKKKKQWG